MLADVRPARRVAHHRIRVDNLPVQDKVARVTVRNNMDRAVFHVAVRIEEIVDRIQRVGPRFEVENVGVLAERLDDLLLVLHARIDDHQIALRSIRIRRDRAAIQGNRRVTVGILLSILIHIDEIVDVIAEIRMLDRIDSIGGIRCLHIPAVIVSGNVVGIRRIRMSLHRRSRMIIGIRRVRSIRINRVVARNNLAIDNGIRRGIEIGDVLRRRLLHLLLNRRIRRILRRRVLQGVLRLVILDLALRDLRMIVHIGGRFDDLGRSGRVEEHPVFQFKNS